MPGCGWWTGGIINKAMKTKKTVLKITCDYCQTQTEEGLPDESIPSKSTGNWISISFNLGMSSYDFCSSECVKKYIDEDLIKHEHNNHNTKRPNSLK